MKSIRDIYKTGKGPSSSHTMGPERAALLFRARYPEADRFQVTLYGSLSKTGVGHGTDRVLRDTLGEKRTEVVFSQESFPGMHPNTMDFTAFQGDQEIGQLLDHVGKHAARYLIQHGTDVNTQNLGAEKAVLDALLTIRCEVIGDLLQKLLIKTGIVRCSAECLNHNVGRRLRCTKCKRSGCAVDDVNAICKIEKYIGLHTEIVRCRIDYDAMMVELLARYNVDILFLATLRTEVEAVVLRLHAAESRSEQCGQ